MPSDAVLVSRLAVRAAQILIWSCSCVFLPSMSTAIRTDVFSFVGAHSILIYSIDKVCLVDHVDLICSFYSWWEGFGSSSLATLPLGFNCGFISTSACGSSTGVCSWGCPGGLGFAPVRCGGGAAAWVSGVLAAPGTQEGWQLGQQEIQCSRRVWQPILANSLQCSCLENCPPWQRRLAGHSLQGRRVGLDRSDPEHIDTRLFACGSSAPVRVESEDSAAAWLAGTLVAPSGQGHGLPPLQELWPPQSLFSSLL